jgi:peptide/nickel transport system permease protein
MSPDATGATLPLAFPAPSPPAAGFFRRAWRVGRRRPPAPIGAAVVALFVLLAVGAPVIAPFDPVATNWSQVRKAPSWAHPFGTDDLGRDGLSRVIWGTRISMQAGVASILFAMAVGVPLGFAAGFYRGAIDTAIMRLTDAWLAFPFLILAIGLVAILGPSLINATLAIGVGATPTYVRLTRGLVLSTKEEDYVQGARALGAGDLRVMARHILPNVTSTIIVQATVQIPTAIIAEAVLSFLGLGVQPPAPSWGTMLNAAQQFLEQAPWMAIWPGAAIFLLALSFNLAGDGLRDILDPRDY